MPVARIPKSKVNCKPKEAGREAKRLATPNAQGIHRQTLLGPGFQQGWAEEAADGRLIWVEGNVEETVQQQQQQQEEVKDEYFKIPKKFKMGHKALLAATAADWERGAIGRDPRDQVPVLSRHKAQDVGGLQASL